jgi:DNA primase
MMDWLHRRGITPEVISLFNVTIHDHPMIGECIRIPYTSEHSKYRRDPLQDVKPKYLYDKGGKVTLYGLDILLEKQPASAVPLIPQSVLVTEGELDTLVAWSKNIPAVSSTGGAMSFQEEWAITLAPYQVYLAFDNDDAGAEGMVRVMKYIPDAKVILIPETPGVKDISDYVSRGGDLHELMSTAKSYPDVASVEEDKKQRAASWQSVKFHDKFLDAHRQKEQRVMNPNPYTGDDRVLKAKSYPMENLVEFSKRSAVCPWHTEKTPSLHFYPKTNSAYCFGACGRKYDSIDAYMHKHSVTFKVAIDELNKLV